MKLILILLLVPIIPLMTFANKEKGVPMGYKLDDRWTMKEAVDGLRVNKNIIEDSVTVTTRNGSFHGKIMERTPYFILLSDNNISASSVSQKYAGKTLTQYHLISVSDISAISFIDTEKIN